jgi:alanine dehydrogenase
VRVLDRSDTLAVAGFEPGRQVGLAECVDAVESALRAHGEGQAFGLGRRQAAGPAGAFHVTSGGYPELLSVKVNGHFPPAGPGEPVRLTGAILLFDAQTGEPSALLDSLIVTQLRTAAITAIAASHLARADARTALLVGAGRQARGQVHALKLTQIERLLVFDRTPERASELVQLATSLGLVAESADDLSQAAQASDVIVTVTRAESPVLARGDVSPGALVVALGADGPGKQELHPLILEGAVVVVDMLEQAAESGELARAIEAGVLTRGDVRAELGEIVAGRKPGRGDAGETFVFDSTGTGLQDAATAALVVEAARRDGIGRELELSA